MACGKDINGGQIWEINGAQGCLCESCEQSARLRQADEYYTSGRDRQLPEKLLSLVRSYLVDSAVAKLSDDWLRRSWGLHDEIRKEACADPAAGRWVVQQLPLRPGSGKIRAVGLFKTKEQARWFCSFWGNHVFTEVRILEAPSVADALRWHLYL
jgi:hypothetical protein